MTIARTARSTSRTFALAIAALVGALLVPAESSAARRDVLVYCAESSPESLNPQLTLSGTARNATTTTIYDRLVDFRPGTTEVAPGLAESWTLSDDRKTYVFKLRRGVSFHRTAFFEPKREMNASDVLFSFLRQHDTTHPFHRVGGGNYPYFQGMGMQDLIESVKKVDDYTVRVRLAEPNATFLPNLAMPFMSILSSEYAEKLIAEGAPERIDMEPIGTGPYAFKSFVRGSTIRYIGHADHWNGEPAMRRLVFAITPDASVRVQKVKMGECHIAVSPPPASYESIRRHPLLDLTEQGGLNVAYIAMNVEKTPFEDVRVRRAIAHALDKRAYIEALYMGTAEPAINPYPPAMWSYTEAVRQYPHDVEEAKRLMREAGFADGFDVTLWTLPVSRPYNPNGRKMGEMMQADLAAIGIRVELETYDWATYLDKVRRGEHEIVQLGWTGDNGDPDNFLTPLFSCDSVSRGSNNARYCNEEFERLISAGRSSADRKARAESYEKALGILSEDVPAIPLVHARVYRLLRREVSGYVSNPFDLDYFSSISLVRE